MNIDHILRTFNASEVEYLLIGGMNFLLRHEPVLTYDIDFWILDTAANLDRCDSALRQLDASWGPTEDSWRPVAEQAGWLTRLCPKANDGRRGSRLSDERSRCRINRVARHDADDERGR
jgi:hypothetical protein